MEYLLVNGQRLNPDGIPGMSLSEAEGVRRMQIITRDRVPVRENDRVLLTVVTNRKSYELPNVAIELAPKRAGHLAFYRFRLPQAADLSEEEQAALRRQL